MHRSSTLLVLLAGISCVGETSGKDSTTSTTDTTTTTTTTTHHTTDTTWVDRGWSDADTDTDTDTDTDSDTDADTDTGHTGAPHSGLRWHTGHTGTTP